VSMASFGGSGLAYTRAFKKEHIFFGHNGGTLLLSWLYILV